jgi:hypothetical protein
MSPPDDARDEALWTVRAVKVDAGLPRVDPYLVWANATHYRDLDAASRERIPIAIEMKRGGMSAQAFARLIERQCWQDWIWVSALYRDAPAALVATRFCTAHVTHRFFKELDTTLAGMFERFTLAVPIHTGHPNVHHTVRTDSALLTPAPRGDDSGQVIVGVCDDAIAFAHRRFHEDASGQRTRFRSFWNQSDTADTAPGLGYGSELLKLQMDARLRSKHRLPDEAGVVSITSHSSHSSHASHAHDDSPLHETPLPLIGVQFGTAGRALRDAAGLRLDVQALDAVRYVIKRAQDTCGPSCHALINLSYDHVAGPRDGSSLIESALDELMDSGACSIVLPAGDAHRSRCQGVVTVEQRSTLRWHVSRECAAPSFVEIWLPADTAAPRVDVCIAPPSGAPGEWITTGHIATYARQGETLCTVVHRGRGARGDGHMILIALAERAAADSHHAVAAPGDWLIHLRNRADAAIDAAYSCARHASLTRVNQPRA